MDGDERGPPTNGYRNQGLSLPPSLHSFASLLHSLASVPSSHDTQYSSGYKRGSPEVPASHHGAAFSGNNLKSLRNSVDDSLRKLRTTYIDILYVHWWDWMTSVEEVMGGLHRLVEEGKVLYLVRPTSGIAASLSHVDAYICVVSFSICRAYRTHLRGSSRALTSMRGTTH